MKQNIMFFLLFILGCGTFYSILISFSRSGNSGNEAIEGIARYFGEPFPNLGVLYWGKCKYFPQGEMMFSFISDVLPQSWTPYERVLFWTNKMGIPTYNFKTIFGHFYIEYGWFYGIIIITCFSLAFYYFFQKKGVTIRTLPIAYFYYQICVFSFDGFTKANESSLHQAILLIFLYIFIPKLVKSRN